MEQEKKQLIQPERINMGRTVRSIRCKSLKARLLSEGLSECPKPNGSDTASCPDDTLYGLPVSVVDKSAEAPVVGGRIKLQVAAQVKGDRFSKVVTL